ncbi:MAG: hypothetical protein R3F30_12500 [Planctomycetota bacterium]
MTLRRLFQRTERVLRARLHYWIGRFWLMTGRKDRAEREFREVLSQVGEDFQASLYLGRIALEAGDLPRALREMSAARRTSPSRFAKLKSEIWQRLPETRRARTEAPAPAQTGTQDEGPLPHRFYWHGAGFEVDAAAAGPEGLGDPDDDLDGDGDLFELLSDAEVEALGPFEAPDDGEEPELGGSPLDAFYAELLGADEEAQVEGPGSPFADEDEERRFATLPPITWGDIDEVDWDELTRRLAEDAGRRDDGA